MFNPKIILIIFSCVAVNVFYSYKNFPAVLYGVEGSFNLLTAIPWIATVFPFFVMTGAYFSLMEENKIFLLSRIKKINIYHVYFVLTIIFSAIVYCLFYVALACLFGGKSFEILCCGVLICANIILVAMVQWCIYSVKKSVMASLLTVIFIIVFPLLFYKNNFNIGAWAMFVKTDSLLICIPELLFSALIFCLKNYLGEYKWQKLK